MKLKCPKCKKESTELKQVSDYTDGRGPFDRDAFRLVCDSCLDDINKRRPNLRQIEDTYEKSYDGEAQEIVGQVMIDPLVAAILPGKQMLFLNLIGWGTLTNSSKLSVNVRICMFRRDSVNTHIASAIGFQDINLELNKDGQVMQVYRHRSAKYISAGSVFLDIISDQANAARELGIPIVSKSIRDEDTAAIGYNVWPKYGFDACIPGDIASKMYNKGDKETTRWFENYLELNNCNADEIPLSSIFLEKNEQLQAKLRLLWRNYGGTIETMFDTAAGSASFQVLAKAKGVKE